MTIRRSVVEERKTRVLSALQGCDDAVSARELAPLVGWSWQRVARTLCCLVDSSQVSRNVTEYRDAEHRTRKLIRYRAVRELCAFPLWLEPHVFSPAQGRRVRMR